MCLQELERDALCMALCCQLGWNNGLCNRPKQARGEARCIAANMPEPRVGHALNNSLEIGHLNLL